MRPISEYTTLASGFLGAWNEQDVEKVVACYTGDVAYLDPNTRGEVRGADATRRYLSKLFGLWEMHWELRREPYRFHDVDGCAAPWRATFRRPGGTARVAIDGLDIVLLDGDRISRNEVYFDRAALLPLLQGEGG